MKPRRAKETHHDYNQPRRRSPRLAGGEIPRARPSLDIDDVIRELGGREVEAPAGPILASVNEAPANPESAAVVSFRERLRSTLRRVLAAPSRAAPGASSQTMPIRAARRPEVVRAEADSTTSPEQDMEFDPAASLVLDAFDRVFGPEADRHRPLRDAIVDPGLAEWKRAHIQCMLDRYPHRAFRETAREIAWVIERVLHAPPEEAPLGDLRTEAAAPGSRWLHSAPFRVPAHQHPRFETEHGMGFGEGGAGGFGQGAAPAADAVVRVSPGFPAEGDWRQPIREALAEPGLDEWLRAGYQAMMDRSSTGVNREVAGQNPARVSHVPPASAPPGALWTDRIAEGPEPGGFHSDPEPVMARQVGRLIEANSALHEGVAANDYGRLFHAEEALYFGREPAAFPWANSRGPHVSRFH